MSIDSLPLVTFFKSAYAAQATRRKILGRRLGLRAFVGNGGKLLSHSEFSDYTFSGPVNTVLVVLPPVGCLIWAHIIRSKYILCFHVVLLVTFAHSSTQLLRLFVARIFKPVLDTSNQSTVRPSTAIQHEEISRKRALTLWALTPYPRRYSATFFTSVYATRRGPKRKASGRRSGSRAFVGDGAKRNQKGMIELLDAFLHRSNGAPLNFSFSCNLKNYPFPEDNELAERAVLMLISHQWHWGKVKFTWRFQTSPGFPGVRLTNMPELTSLDLYVKLDDGLYRGSGSIDLSRSSRLKYLCLDCPFTLGIGDKPMHLPAADTFDLKLRDFCYGPLTVPQCLDVLEAAPNLRKFRAFSCIEDTSLNCSDHPIVLHNLRILELRNGYAPLVINKLDLPALTALMCGDNGFINSSEYILSFMKRSLPPLTRLELGGNYANEATVAQILPLLPLLQLLDLDPCTISAQLFRLLSVPGRIGGGNCGCDTRNQIVCPDLRWFCFWRYSIVGEPRECADTFCAMLESRWDALKLWDDLAKIGKIQYPISAADRERVQHHFRDMQNFGARSIFFLEEVEDNSLHVAMKAQPIVFG
ncbi:uncharacterized protein FOMMEDRAFT_153879 [Fomitiporia mediterranea MF3/22]|uniref:uncharacterized protein n=1 Tax=Fomitiporia mediterranea (strain MF3/22) TaxID=694068 RepID=UPI00044080BB|nr:uncharacterized protein FOMMEDRAFT_153879 [Fomitiporia mediterranea MF3/22]EJD04786.1 hypothetical protein FOMMEDRAFT_153879 [Fomitiporia mediterranea MF3/22]